MYTKFLVKNFLFSSKYTKRANKQKQTKNTPVFFLFFLLIFVNFMEKEPSAKFCSIFDHYSQSCKGMKCCMTGQCLQVNDFILTNRHTEHANCGLHINFWNFWLMPFCFMIQKDYFKPKLLLWPQSSFKKLVIIIMFMEINLLRIIFNMILPLLIKFTKILRDRILRENLLNTANRSSGRISKKISFKNLYNFG